MLVRPYFLKKVKTAMLTAHPYEEPAYCISQNFALTQEIGYGRICETKQEMSVDELVDLCKEVFGTKVVRFTDIGENNKKSIRKVAVCSGAGGNNYQIVKNLGCDAYITADVKHDQFIGAENIGLTLIDAGHFYTENIGIFHLQKLLKKAFPDIEIRVAESNKDVVRYR
jgi:putative NIF3 family GTP cyclohydrolase 1 type 2